MILFTGDRICVHIYDVHCIPVNNIQLPVFIFVSTAWQLHINDHIFYDVRLIVCGERPQILAEKPPYVKVIAPVWSVAEE